MSDHFDQNMNFKTLPLDFRPFTSMPYTDYGWGDLLAQGQTLALVVPRKVNAKRSMSSVPRSLCHNTRKRVETSFSQITALFARTLRAMTSRCFELKICLALLTFAL
jgi:hypothetical protein